MSAKLSFMLFDALGVPAPGLVVQVKNGGGTTVARTSDGTLTDNADGSYTTATTLAGGAYSVYTGAGAGTVVPSLDPIQHVDEAAVPTSLPVPITEGGTGATSASAARTALGVATGVDHQAYNAHLDRWNVVSAAALAGATDLFLYWNNTTDAWANLSASSFRTALGVAVGTNVQAYHAALDALVSGVDLPPSLVSFPVAEDGTLSLKDEADTRTALGLGTAALDDSTETGESGKVARFTADSGGGGLVLPTRSSHLTANSANLGKTYIMVPTGSTVASGSWGIYTIARNSNGIAYTYEVKTLVANTW